MFANFPVQALSAQSKITSTTKYKKTNWIKSPQNALKQNRLSSFCDGDMGKKYSG